MISKELQDRLEEFRELTIKYQEQLDEISNDKELVSKIGWDEKEDYPHKLDIIMMDVHSNLGRLIKEIEYFILDENYT